MPERDLIRYAASSIILSSKGLQHRNVSWFISDAYHAKVPMVQGIVYYGGGILEVLRSQRREMGEGSVVWEWRGEQDGRVMEETRGEERDMGIKSTWRGIVGGRGAATGRIMGTVTMRTPRPMDVVPAPMATSSLPFNPSVCALTNILPDLLRVRIW